MVGTVDAVRAELEHGGFVRRYSTAGADRRWTGCRATRAPSWPARSGWPTRCAATGRHDEAVELFERLLALRNDVGLLAEE